MSSSVREIELMLNRLDPKGTKSVVASSVQVYMYGISRLYSVVGMQLVN